MKYLFRASSGYSPASNAKDAITVLRPSRSRLSVLASPARRAWHKHWRGPRGSRVKGNGREWEGRRLVAVDRPDLDAAARQPAPAGRGPREGLGGIAQMT